MLFKGISNLTACCGIRIGIVSDECAVLVVLAVLELCI